MATNASSPNQPAAAISPPWSQIVAAPTVAPHSSDSPPPPAVVVDSSSVTSAVTVNTSAVASASVENIDNNSGGNNANIVRRQVWNKPSNAAGSSSVVDAESWPALSESAKSPAKSPPPPPPPKELVNHTLDSSTLPQLQGTGSMLPSPQRQVKDTASVNNMAQGPSHLRPFSRTNSNLSFNGGHQLQMSAPHGTVAAPPGSYNHNKNSAPRDHGPRGGFVPSDQLQHRNSFRNRNGSLHQRGDGSHHHNHGSRRDQDWYAPQRGFNGRDNYRSPRFGPPFMRPAQPSDYAQYIHPHPPPPQFPSFGVVYRYPEVATHMTYFPPRPLDPLGGVPFAQPRQPNVMFIQPPDPQLCDPELRTTMIVDQINYYFSDTNLWEDLYLRNKMDDQGWVPLNLVAGFRMVKLITDDIHIVLDAVRTSSVVELHAQGDKLRRRNDWRNWILHSTPVPNVTGSQIGQLAENVQSIALEQSKNDAAGGLDVSQHIPFSDSNNQYLISTCEGTGHVGIQDSDHSESAKS